MHSSSFDTDMSGKDEGEFLVAIATLVQEGRLHDKFNLKNKNLSEGPHCIFKKTSINEHKCEPTLDNLCSKYGNLREEVLNLHKNKIPFCIEVALVCPCKDDLEETPPTTPTSITELCDDGILLEKWFFNINHRRNPETIVFNFTQLVSAIRSQLYFSQLTVWLTKHQEETFPSSSSSSSSTPIMKMKNWNIKYRLTIPGETYEPRKFKLTPIKHEFPLTDIGNGYTLNVSFLSLPRMSSMPIVHCIKCNQFKSNNQISKNNLKKIINQQQQTGLQNNILFDDRMYSVCNMKGKHRCEDFENGENLKINDKNVTNIKKFDYNDEYEKCNVEEASTSKLYCKKMLWQQNILNSHKNDLNSLIQDKGKLLLDAIERSGQKSTNDILLNNKNSDNQSNCDYYYIQKTTPQNYQERKQQQQLLQQQKQQNCLKQNNEYIKSEKFNGNCDKKESDIISNRGKSKYNFYLNKIFDDNNISIIKMKQEMKTISLSQNLKRNFIKKLQFNNVADEYYLKMQSGESEQKQQITEQEEQQLKQQKEKEELQQPSTSKKDIDLPSAFEQAQFRKDLDNAASMVFHSRTGLPLTSSPAPVRRNNSHFDFDSSLNSVSAIKSALYPSNDDDCESDGNNSISPCSPETNYNLSKRELSPIKYHRKGHASSLLGSFEESVLNGRLEPVSTVHGFTAELGASGSFVPNHLFVPVTVFFYTLGDNDKLSSPYLSHINLSKKGYMVPKNGTIQVTLFNPLGTVVKMFVVLYDLSDMPPNSQTFLRQRTLYMPTKFVEPNVEWGPKWLRYLIHLRFMSSKSGKIYLHSDIRMIIFRKSDLDTATALGNGNEMSFELRSFIHMPTNPRFSPRK